ncbi:hypothetical protein C8Q80DRAFT_914855 [Daedaleopsis nitida]|nr:hypothetical protein C8Q80DRAFT_914855 [Daedaleopsis nitida]
MGPSTWSIVFYYKRLKWCERTLGIDSPGRRTYANHLAASRLEIVGAPRLRLSAQLVRNKRQRETMTISSSCVPNTHLTSRETTYLSSACELGLLTETYLPGQAFKSRVWHCQCILRDLWQRALGGGKGTGVSVSTIDGKSLYSPVLYSSPWILTATLCYAPSTSLPTLIRPRKRNPKTPSSSCRLYAHELGYVPDLHRRHIYSSHMC